MNCIFFTGNFYIQLNALELILKYLTSVNRSTQTALLNDILTQDELKELLVDFRPNSFDEVSFWRKGYCFSAILI